MKPCVPLHKSQKQHFATGSRLTIISVLFFLLSSCSTAPNEKIKIEQPQLSTSEIEQKYLDDQKQRLLLAKNWQIQGILDIDHEEQGRRNRITITARQGDHLRLRIYGPFKQVAVDLLVDPLWLQLVKPSEHNVIRVPATPDGMLYLTGYSLDPRDLTQFLTGTAGPLTSMEMPTGSGMESTTEQGEQLLLNPLSGLTQKRWVSSTLHNPYSVQYYWPKTVRPPKTPLPQKIAISLPKDEMVLTFILRKWQFAKSDSNKKLFKIPEGFSIVEPQI